MRKKILFALLFISILGLFIGLNFNKEVQAETPKGFHVEQVFTDKFNKETLDPSWTLNGATLDLNYNGLHCISPVPYGYGPMINAATLSDRTLIKFTIYPQSGRTDSNISFNIGMATPSTIQSEPNVDCKVMFWNDQLVFEDWQHDLQVNHDKEAEHVLRGFNGLYSDLLRTDVSLYIERKSDTLTHIYAEYSRDGEIVYSSKTTPFELFNPRCPNGYCGFFWDVVEMDLTNFEFYNNDKLVFADDFSDNTLTYASIDASLGNFHVNDSLNESNVYVSRVSSVKMDSANESIVNSYKLEKNSEVTTPYEISYNIKVNSLNDNSFFGFGFGLGDNDTTIDKKNAIGFVKYDDLTAEVVVLKDGVIDRSNNYLISLTKLGNGKYIDASISFDSANNAYLTVNGLKYKFSNVDYAGKLGVGLVDLGGVESTSVEMREISLLRNVHNDYDSEDASNDFSGTRVPDEDEPFFTEPYINNQRFTLGSGVSLEEDWTTGEQYLTFTNVGPYSCFTYAKEYSEWILEFDIELYTHNSSNMFGIAFGRKSIFDVLIQASTSNSAYLLRNDTANTAEITYGADCKFDDGKTYRIAQMDIFHSNTDKFHMMFIGKNRCVYVYYMADGAPLSDMSILRSKITDVNIDGYVAIVGNNNISFGISNYKIVNLSDECTKDSELTLRETFNGDTVTDKIATDGITRVQDGMLVMNDSTFETTSFNLYEMIRFTLNDLNENLQIAFSGDKKVTFDVVKNQIIVKEGNTSTPYDVPEMNLSYIKGKRFEITIFGDKLTIGFKRYYDPQDKLSEVLVEHTFATPLSEDNIRFNANGKVILDDLYIFSLDNSKECLSLSYEDDPNNAEVWKVKPDFDPSKVYKYEEESSDENTEEEVIDDKGCKSSISALSAVIFTSLTLPVLYVLKRKEEEK